jgi:hypothetical protein
LACDGGAARQLRDDIVAIAKEALIPRPAKRQDAARQGYKTLK